MAYALVGSIGAISTGTSGGAITPSYGQTTTLHNLLILQVAGFGTATLPSAPSGWSIAKQEAGTSCSVSVFYKVAAGSDATPTVAAVTSTILVGRLEEHSGGAIANPIGFVGGAAGTTSPITGTASAADAVSGDLIIVCGASHYSSSSGTKTLALTSNNATLTSGTNSGGASLVDVYDFAYGNSTSNVAADTGVNTFSTTHITGAAVAVASFRLPIVGAASDTVFSSDSASPAVQIFTCSASDTAFSSDSATGHPQLLIRTTSDTVFSSDSASKSVQHFTRSASDTGFSSDSASRSFNRTRTTSDTVFSSDSASRSSIHPRSATDTLASSQTSPTFVSGSINSSGGSSVAVNAPTSIVASNLLVGIAYQIGYVDDTVPLVAPSGWSTYWSHAVNTLEGTALVCYKYATASEPSTYTFASGDGQPPIIAAVLQYSNVNATTPFDGATPVYNPYTSTTNPFVAPSTSPVNVADVLISFFASTGGDSVTSAPSMNSREGLQNGANSQSLYVYDNTLTNNSSTPTESLTWSSASYGLAVSLLLNSNSVPFDSATRTYPRSFRHTIPSWSTNSYLLTTAYDNITGLALGSDGNVWGAEYNTVSSTGNIVKIQPNGTLTYYPLSGALPIAICSASDGLLYVADNNGAVWKVDPTNPSAATQYALTAGTDRAVGICQGPDNNIWIADSGNFTDAAVWMLPLGGGTPTKYSVNGGNAGVEAICSDGTVLWFTDGGTATGDSGGVWSITTAGSMTKYALTYLGAPAASGYGIALGSDGRIWFNDDNASGAKGLGLWAFNTTSHVGTFYPIAMGHWFYRGMVLGPDGNIWVPNNADSGLWQVTTSGVAAFFPVPGGAEGIAVGADNSSFWTGSQTPNGSGFLPVSVGHLLPDAVFASDTATRSTQTFTRTAGSDTVFSSDIAVKSSRGATVTASDTVFSSDSASRSTQSFNRSSSDTVFSSDSVSRNARSFTRSSTDIAFSSDTVSRGTRAFIRSSSDTVFSADSSSRAIQVFTRSASDTSFSSDSAVRSFVLTRTSSDTVFSTDSASRATQSFVRSTNNTVFSSDTASRFFDRIRTTSDTVFVSDSAGRSTQSFTRSASDTCYSSDSASRTRSPSRSTSNVVFVSDAASRAAQIFIRSTSDTTFSSDSATRAASFSRSTNDTVLSSDSASTSAQTFVRSAPDTAFTSDTAIKSGTGNVSASDTAFASDGASRSVQVFTRSTSDSVSISETTSRQTLHLTRSAPDTAFSSDSGARSLVVARSSNDTVLSSDSASRASQTLHRSASDSVSISDSSSVKTTITRSTNDTVLAGDTASRIARFTRTTLNTVFVSDAAFKGGIPTRSTSDFVFSSDSAIRASQHFARTSVNTVFVTDSAVNTSPSTKSASDSLSIIDSARIASFSSASDAVFISDSAARSTQSLNRFANDTAFSSDLASRQVRYIHVASDTVFSFDSAICAVVVRSSNPGTVEFEIKKSYVGLTYYVPAVGMSIRKPSVSMSHLVPEVESSINKPLVSANA